MKPNGIYIKGIYILWMASESGAGCSVKLN